MDCSMVFVRVRFISSPSSSQSRQSPESNPGDQTSREIPANRAQKRSRKDDVRQGLRGRRCLSSQPYCLGRRTDVVTSFIDTGNPTDLPASTDQQRLA